MDAVCKMSAQSIHIDWYMLSVLNPLLVYCVDVYVSVYYHRLVEEADFKATTELFGKRPDGKSLDSFIPKSESDFAEYAELISSQIRPYDVS